MNCLLAMIFYFGKTLLSYFIKYNECKFEIFQVHQALGLEALKNRTFQIFKASAIKGDGLDESMEWLSNALQARK